MSYKVGDMVVYPRHGAAKVEAITERTVKGVTREYLQLSVLSSDGLVINVPVDNAKKVGVRDIVSASEVAKVFGILRTPIIEKEMNWSRRYKLNVEKIATGDVNKIAEVVRDLAQRDVDEHGLGRQDEDDPGEEVGGDGSEGGDGHHGVLAVPVDQRAERHPEDGEQQHVGAAHERGDEHRAGLEVGPERETEPDERRAEHRRRGVAEDVHEGAGAGALVGNHGAR